MTLAQGFEIGRQLSVERQRQGRPAVVLLRRARTVRRQHQQRRRIDQGLPPVAALGLQDFAAQPAALPQGIVAVLHGQRRQRIVQVMPERFVERCQLLDQHPHGPGIRNDVVHGHQQHMLLVTQANQPATDQRAVFQVEGVDGFPRRQGVYFGFAIDPLGKVMLQQGETAIGRGDTLPRLLALGLYESRAQRLMAGNDAIQCPLQGDVVQRAAQTQAGRHMVGRAGPFHLRQEPQALLSE